MNIPLLVLSLFIHIRFQAALPLPVTVDENLTTISGRVTDISSGEELSGVEIRISGSEKEFYTDFNGAFKIENLQPGTNYTLEINFISYRKMIIKDVNTGIHPVQIKLSGERKERATGQIPYFPAG